MRVEKSVKRYHNCNPLGSVKGLNWQGDSKNGDKGTHRRQCRCTTS